jgi:plastocyanin
MRLATPFLSLALAALALLPAAVGATTYDVQIGPAGANSYSPQDLPAINVNDAVRFVWVSGTHPTMSDSSPAAWPTFTLGPTATMQTVTFTKAGTYPYHCTIHASSTGNGSFVGMIGSITVRGAALATTPFQYLTPTLSVFPNPARGLVSVQLSAQHGPDYKLRLSNVLGREVRLMPLSLTNANVGVPLDVSGLPAGLYFCSLLVNDKAVSTNRLTLL